MRCLALILGAAVLATSVGAAAAKFDILVVKGSKSEAGSFDRDIGPYTKQLKEIGYKSAHVTSSLSFNLAMNKTRSFDVSPKVEAEITPTKVKDGFIHFDLKVSHPGKDPIRIGYKIPDGKHTIISRQSKGPHKYILIIKARR